MANLEKLQVTVDARIDSYKKKMNEVKDITKTSMQKVEGELSKAKGPELDISVDKSLEKVSKAVEKVKKKVDEVNKVKVGGDNMKGMQNAADQTTGKLGKVQESVKTARNAIREVIKTNPVLAKLQTVLSAVVTAGKKGFGMLATAVDKTRSAISKVSGVAQSLVQKFRAMVAPIKNDAASILHIGRNSETAAKKVGLLSGAVGKLVGLISAFAIFNFAKSCIELGSDLQEVQNVVDTVFPHMKGQINSWAKDAATNFGLSETMAKKYAGTFGAMAKSFGFVESAAYEMSTKLAGLSGDVASFYNITQDEAYTKLKSVFTGETESLKELGIVMTQNALDQYALANGFGKVTSAMTEQEKVALRYAFVQDKLKNATGDFVRTQDGWANQVRMLNLQFQSLKATIGEGLINVFTPVIKVINILLSKIATVANAFKALTSLLFGKAGKASGGTIGDSTADIAGGFDDAADSAGNLADATDKAGDAAADAAKKALGLMAFDKINKLADDAASSSGGSGSGSGGGGGAGGITGDDVDFGEIEEEAETIGDKMAAIFDVFQQAWENKGQRVIDAWTEALNSIKTLASDVGDSFFEVFTNGTGQRFLENILELFADIADIVNAFATALDEAWEKGEAGTKWVQSLFDKWNAIIELIDAIADAFVNVWNNGTGAEILGHILAIMTNINEAVANLVTRFKEAWEEGGRGEKIWQNILNIINTILTHVENITGYFRDWAAKVDFGPLLDSLNNLLEAINHLVDVAGDKLEWLVQHVILPLATMTIEEGLPNFINHIADALNALADGDFTEAGKAVAEALNGIIQTVRDFVTDGGLQDAVVNLAKDIANFINGAFSELDFKALGETVGGLLVTAMKGINAFLEEVDWQQIGRDIVDFISGINFKELFKNSTLVNVAKSIFETIQGALGNIDWVDVGIAVSDGIIKALNGLTSLLQKVDWNGIGESIGGFLSGIDWVSMLVSAAILIVQGLLSLGGAAIGVIEGFAKGIVQQIISYLDPDALEDAGGDIIQGLFNGIGTAISNVGKWIKENIFDPFISGFKSIFGIASPSKVMEEQGGYVGQGFLNGVGNALSNVGDWLKEHVLNPIKDWFSGQKWDDLKVSISAKLDETFDKAKAAFDAIKDSDVVKTIKGKLGDAWESTKSAFEAVKDGEALKTVKGKVADAFNSAKESFDKVKDSDAVKTIKGTVADAFKTAKEKFDNLKDNSATKTIKGSTGDNWKTIKEKFDALKSNSATKTIKGSTADSFTSRKKLFNGVKSNTATKTIAGKTSDTFTKRKNSWDSVKSKTATLTVSVSGIASGIRTWLNTNVRAPLANLVDKIPGLSASIVPYFANGAYLPANTPTLAMVGDNRNHAEYVAPEPKLQAMADRAAEKAGTKLDYAQLQRLIEAAVYAATTSANRQSGGNEVSVKIDGDPKKMFNVVVEQIRSYYRQHGQLPFPI